MEKRLSPKWTYICSSDMLENCLNLENGRLSYAISWLKFLNHTEYCMLVECMQANGTSPRWFEYSGTSISREICYDLLYGML